MGFTLIDLAGGVGGSGSGEININLELQSRTVDSSTNSQLVKPTDGYIGLKDVTVTPYVLDSSTATITENGDYVFESNEDGLSRVDVSVDVNGVYDEKTVDSSTVLQIVTSDEDALSKVTVNPYVLDSKTVDSSTNPQVVTSDEDGLRQVTINPYVLDSLEVDSSTASQELTGQYGTVTVNPYTLDSKTVDSSTNSQVVVSDADGLSQVTVNPYTLDSKTVDPSTNQQTITSSEDGLSSVTVNGVTSSIDSNILASNIKDGVTILGVQGTFEGGTLQNKTIDSSTVSQIVLPDNGNYGLGQVTVNPYTLDSSSAVITENGEYVFTSGVDGLSRVDVSVNLDTEGIYLEGYSDGYTAGETDGAAEQKAKLDSSTFTSNGTFTREDGWNSVTVNVDTVNNQNKTVDSSTSSQTVIADSGYTGLGQVVINPYILDSSTLEVTSNGQYTVISAADGLSRVDVSVGIDTQSYYDSGYSDGETAGIAEGITQQKALLDSSTFVANGTYTRSDGWDEITVNVPIPSFSTQSKTVDSSTSSQTVTPDSGYDGLSQVTVNPYSLQAKTSPAAYEYVNSDVAPSPSLITITPDSGYDALSQVYVGKFSILSSKTFTPSTTQQTWDAYNDSDELVGLRTVVVSPVTSSIDSNISAGNIKDGVTILGVTGTYSGTTINNQNKTIDSSTAQQTVTFDSGYTGLGTVTITGLDLDTIYNTLAAY